MKISINIIEKYFRNYIVLKNIRNDADLTIETYEIYDSNNCVFKEDCLYLMKSDEMPNPEVLADNLNIICWGISKEFDIEKYKNINLLIIDGITPEKNINEIISIFHIYNTFEDRLDSQIFGKVSLQEIIDLATEIVEMPLNILDLNHKVLASSSKVEAPEDPLWEAMKSGYLDEHYEHLLDGSPTMSDIIKSKGNSVEIISSISGHFVKVLILRNGGRPIAYFGMHKSYDLEKPFEKHTIQLYDYLVKKISENQDQLFEIKADRGLIYEEFLHDVFNQKFKNSYEIDAISAKLGFNMDSRYQMVVISFKESNVKVDYYFAIMDYLERNISDSKCIAMDAYIYIIIPIFPEDYLSDEIQKNIIEFIDFHNCFCVLSPPFISFLELYKFNSMFKTILEFIVKQGRDETLYHYYEFENLYSMKLLSNNMPSDWMYHPMIQKLLDYDQQHKSDYLETFKVYLRNESSISATSNLLHMHRNSLQYRINRIEQLLGNRFEDWKLREQLLFQMTYLEYQDVFSKKL